MNNLNQVVSTFSKEEQQQFIAYLKRKNKRTDVKNIQLFKLLIDDNYSSKAVCTKLYGSTNNTAYHALRKRLFQSIISFSAKSSLEDESSLQMEVIKLLLASRNYLQQKQYSIAYKILSKAEGIAKEHHFFSLLNEIYHTKIQYAYAVPEIDLDNLIKAYNNNKEQHIKEDKLNIVYSKIRQELQGGTTNDFETIINSVLKTYRIDATDSLSFKSLYQMVSIASISAFVSKDYLKIESFLIKTYHDILSYKSKEKQPFYHIQILYHIANALFRNKKFKASEDFLNLMHKQMLSHNKKIFNTFKLRYYLLLSLNYNFTYKQELAIKTLEPYSKTKHIDIACILDIELSLMMFYFQNEELKKAHQVLSKFYHSDNWYSEKAGAEWVIKKNLAEILLHIELGNIDVVESKLLRFKRHHYSFLKLIHQERVIAYVELVKQYYKKPEIVTSKNFKTLVESTFNFKTPRQEDIFVMSFYAWLKSKINKTALYNTTMKLIESAQQQ